MDGGVGLGCATLRQVTNEHVKDALMLVISPHAWPDMKYSSRRSKDSSSKKQHSCRLFYMYCTDICRDQSLISLTADGVETSADCQKIGHLTNRVGSESTVDIDLIHDGSIH